MDKRELKRLEKILFAMLGRQPDAFGIVLDEGGWASIKELHQALMKETGFSHITQRGLTQLFSLYRPEKFEWREKHVRVKPELQGPDLTIYKESTPPELLYVSIRPKAHAHVITRGLQSSNNKKWVVLSTEKEMALKIGRRRDKDPVIVEVMALKSSKAGVVFRRAGKVLYLVEGLDPQWMNIPPLPPVREKDKHKKPKSGKAGPVGKKIPKDIAPRLEQIGAFVLRDTPSHIVSSGLDKIKRNKKSRDRDPEWKKARRRRKRAAKNKMPT
jgi:putative RNA 2'-phosphotransferase